MKTPVQTWCSRPLKRLIIAAASRRLAGLPITLLLRATRVSAPSTTASGRARATTIAFRVALQIVSSRIVNAALLLSATAGETTSNLNPASDNKCRRRGEPDARTKGGATRAPVLFDASYFFFGEALGFAAASGLPPIMLLMSGIFISW